MWYVIQAFSGNEEEIKSYLSTFKEYEDIYDDIFIPIYEEVRRKAGKNRILFRKMFPGYIFIETTDAEKLFFVLKKIPEFTKILGEESENGTKSFIPVSAEDEEFLKSILDDGIMHVSFLETSDNNRKIEKIVGPLARYRDSIRKIDTSHREAVVETDIFGKHRKICFGIWKKGDPMLPWLEEQMREDEEKKYNLKSVYDKSKSEKSNVKSDNATYVQAGENVGLSAGDKVRDITGVYGDYVFTVERINVNRKIIQTQIELCGGMRKIELYLDAVEKV